MPDEEFRLPGASYDKLQQIIIAYGEQKGPVTTSEVANVIDIHPTQVSRNNGFLVSVGVIEEGPAQSKEMTPKGQELANALHWGIEKDVQRLWRQLLRGNEFIDKILSAVKVRKGMELSNLESHIAYTSGRKKTSKVITGAGAVVDILLIAGFLEEVDGQLVVAGQLDGSGEDDEKTTTTTSTNRSEWGRQFGTRDHGISSVRITAAPLSIQLQIQCSADDLDEVGSKLRALIVELQRDPGEGTSESAE